MLDVKMGSDCCFCCWFSCFFFFSLSSISSYSLCLLFFFFRGTFILYTHKKKSVFVLLRSLQYPTFSKIHILCCFFISYSSWYLKFIIVIILKTVFFSSFYSLHRLMIELFFFLPFKNWIHFFSLLQIHNVPKTKIKKKIISHDSKNFLATMHKMWRKQDSMSEQNIY